MEYIGRNAQPLHPKPVYLTGTKDLLQVEIALMWTDAYQEGVSSFANNINTREGGTHLTGLRRR